MEFKANMEFENLKYVSDPSTDTNMCIFGLFNGQETFIPIGGNEVYDEIMRQVEAGTLTIAPAD